MSRIDIHRDEREAERVIQQAVASTLPAGGKPSSAEDKLSEGEFPKEQKAVLYRALNEARGRKRNDSVGISFADMCRELPARFRELNSEATLLAMLNEMDHEAQIHYDRASDRIYP